MTRTIDGRDAEETIWVDINTITRTLATQELIEILIMATTQMINSFQNIMNTQITTTVKEVKRNNHASTTSIKRWMITTTMEEDLMTNSKITIIGIKTPQTMSTTKYLVMAHSTLIRATDKIVIGRWALLTTTTKLKRISIVTKRITSQRVDEEYHQSLCGKKKARLSIASHLSLSKSVPVRLSALVPKMLLRLLFLLVAPLPSLLQSLIVN